MLTNGVMDAEAALPAQFVRFRILDAVYVFKDETVKSVAKFDDFASTEHPFMYRCHMSNHEDEGLMGQFLVVEE